MSEGKHKIGIQKFDVGLEDGSEWTVVAKHKDLLAWEDFAAPKHWDAKSRSVRATIYLAWSASRRDGFIPKVMTFEAFADAIDYCDEGGKPEEEEGAPFPGGQLPPAADRDSGGDGVDPAGVA